MIAFKQSFSDGADTTALKAIAVVASDETGTSKPDIICRDVKLRAKRTR